MAWSFKKPFGKLFQEEIDWEHFQDTLITADFGSMAAEQLVEYLQANSDGTVRDVKRLLREQLEERLDRFDPTLRLTERPAVIIMVGVNGVGKTTTVGKLTRLLAQHNKKVIVGAADTFRAAAAEQVASWAQRSGAAVVLPPKPGHDPASVAYTTVERAVRENFDVAIIDTAGRLQNKNNLMDELSKIKRVIEKLVPIAEVLLVLDASTGQNGLAQVQAFLEHAGITGIVLSKADGSAKAGFVLQVQEKTGVPVKLVGTGEGAGDLSGFVPHQFAARLLED